VSLDLQKRGSRVGYLPGAGNSVAEALAEMGYKVQFCKYAFYESLV
jgi:hypothetical protein